jgi:hypothetical protein
MQWLKFGVLYRPTYVPELDGPEGTFYARMLESATLHSVELFAREVARVFTPRVAEAVRR